MLYSQFKMWRAWIIVLLCVYVKESLGQGDYLIGAGIADITGPAADVPLVSSTQLVFFDVHSLNIFY